MAKQKYRDINGETKVGKFLRSLNLKETLPNILNAGIDIASGDFRGALNNFIGSSKELTPEQRQHALKLLEFDMQEMIEVTKRLQTDNEHEITRLVRPVSYAAMFLLFMICVFFDGNVGEFTIDEKYVPVIESLFWIQTTFYFGSRGLEKMMKVFKSKD